MTKTLSASRLNNFLECRHQTALWLAGVEPDPEIDPSLELLRKSGLAHEAKVLARLEAEFGPAVHIPASGPLDGRIEATRQAIQDGSPLIYQAAFRSNGWVGYPDFLVRRPQPGSGFEYQAEDAKLSRRAKASHVTQLNIYAWLLSENFTIVPGQGVIHVGGDEQPAVFDLRKTQHIVRHYMTEFEDFVALERRETKSVRVSACSQCPYQKRCEAEWRAADSPVFIAGISNDQIAKLEAAGASTLTAIAELKDDQSVPKLAATTQERLVAQARLQANFARTNEYKVEPLPVEPGRGFTTLPPPAGGDLFFDMEGDPHYPERLEYLFGIWGPTTKAGNNEFTFFWAHDHAAEKRAFEDLMDYFGAHIRAFPTAHIYHYAAYEITALKRLSMRYATREAELDQLLRDQRFVDLYRVVRQSVRASTESYSLKDLEKIYWGGRGGDVSNAGDSIVEYEKWRDLGDQSILDAILDYNRQDCVSTQLLRDWLEALRPDDGEYCVSSTEDRDEAKAAEQSAKRSALEQQRRSIAEQIAASADIEEGIKSLVTELMWFHQRSQKPQWWAMFDRLIWSDDDLVDDLESIGALERDSSRPVEAVAKSGIAHYLFPPQETKLKKGSTPRFAPTGVNAGTIVDLDVDAGCLSLKRGNKSGEFPDRASLTPPGPISAEVLQAGVLTFADSVSRGTAQPYQAVLDCLARRHPNMRNHQPGDVVVPGRRDLVDETIDAIGSLDASFLVIQGPPGTGKTYASARAIVSLLQSGARVGVTSNSHKAINNLLAEIERLAGEACVSFHGAKKATAREPETEFDGSYIHSVYSSDHVEAGHQLVGATAYHFARPSELGAYDYLFVDEAGQVSLGNLVAMGGAARNLVLVGDQMQLPQPVQGTHPGESGLSCLEFVMAGHATVPPDRGILLNVSRRMNPKVCGFISSAVYDDRLSAHASTSIRALRLKPNVHPAIQSAGVSWFGVQHEGCTQSSIHEARVIKDIIGSLLQQSRMTSDGPVALGLKDILVVAPYNLQVNLLKRELPAGTRVGTVDKFQGQEATVSIVSMTTSSGDDAPRGSDFLFSTNRANVAVSRAEALSIIVCGERLLDYAKATIADLERLNFFARAKAEAA